MDLQGRLLSIRTALVLGTLALGPAAIDIPVAHAGNFSAESDESSLLNFRLELPTLDSWDAQQREWSASAEGSKAPPRVRIVHLWSTVCKPCEAEFPILKQMDQQLRTDYRGDVQFVYVADAVSSRASMSDFMNRNHMSMPLGVLYRDRENQISTELGWALPAGPVEELATAPSERQLGLPLTLLVDEDNVIRRAFLGSLIKRRGEFVNALAQLYEAVRQRGQRNKSASR